MPVVTRATAGEDTIHHDTLPLFIDAARTPAAAAATSWLRLRL